MWWYGVELRFLGGGTGIVAWSGPLGGDGCGGLGKLDGWSDS